MRQILVPVFLLGVVAGSSSNILPMMTTSQLEELSVDGQENDNIFRNRFETRHNLNNMFNKVQNELSKYNRLQRKSSNSKLYPSTDRGKEYFDEAIDKEDNYNGEGFWKDQWHNYPRQLDRLNGRLFKDKEREQNDPEKFETLDANHDITNEYLVESKGNTEHIYDAVVAATNPLLILKIRLSCMSDGPGSRDFAPKTSDATNDADDEEAIFTNEVNPSSNFMELKENSPDVQEYNPTDASEKKTVKKRLFSLWSRLQSLSHKGHELQHRRHLAFYGFPEEAGGLTADTRALMRPPGSPLRWG